MEKKYLLLAVCTMIILSACKKEKQVIPVDDHPVMKYTIVNLELKSWSLKSIDVDGDGKKDLSFEVYPVGDPVLQQDKISFFAYSSLHTSLLTDGNDNPPILTGGETVKPVHPGYEWWPLSNAQLAQKIIPANEPVFWTGVFRDANKKYLPFKMAKNNQDYYGWIELSIDKPSEKLIIHRTGLSTEAGKVVKAGF
jgi:hypothetical protein